MSRWRTSSSGGFTIIELLLATSFFTIVMLMVVAGYVQINRSYTRGLTVKEVQNSARVVMDDISRSIRDATAAEVSQPADYRLEAGAVCYLWNQEDLTSNDTLTSFTYADESSTFITLVRTTDPNACATGVVNQADTTTETLLDERLMVQHLAITSLGSSNSYRIELIVSSDARGDFSGDFVSLGADAACTVQKGDEFCDIAKLETVVTARN